MQRKNLNWLIRFVVKCQLTYSKQVVLRPVRKKVATHALIKTVMKAIGKKYGHKKLGAKALNLSRQMIKRVNIDKANWWKPNPRMKRKDAINAAVKQILQIFYLSQEISREVPNKKDVVCIKEGKEKQYVQKHVMIMTSADAYSLIHKAQNDSD